MSKKRPCSNPSCARFIEENRNKSAKYCEACSRRRSSLWKKAHPERVKLYGDENRPKKPRDKTAWNAYMRLYRQKPKNVNMSDPSVKALTMFVVFLSALMTLANFGLGVAATHLVDAEVGGAFFTASGVSLMVAYRLIKLIIG